MGGNQSTRLYNQPIDEKKDGQSQIMRHPTHTKELIYQPLPGIDNIQDLILHGYNLNKTKEFLGTKNTETNQYEYVTYDHVMQQAKGLGSALKNLHLLKEANDYKDYKLNLVGIYAKNRVEWTVADIANALYGYTMVPLYDSLGPDSISYVLAHSGISTCYCSTPSITTLSKTKDLHHLKNIIALDPVPEDLESEMKKRGITIYKYADVIAKGSENVLPFPKITTDQIFTFSYTSGTTGNPKGAMISHRNVLGAVSNHKNSDVSYLPSDIHMSYLPLPHIFERFVNVSCWLQGTQIAFFSGDILKLKDDILAARPTALMTVPRLLNRFYDGIRAKLNEATGVKKSLIDHALETKLENIAKDGDHKHMVYDALVFSKVREVFGGRLRILCSGSAPISPKVMDFFKAVLSCNVIEGYGQTEGTGLQTAQCMAENRAGHVGGILPSLELKLQDVPDMEYLSTDKDEKGNPMPRGEICIRGHSLFPGYYKDEEKTKEAVDPEGWLHSGDIGVILPNGGLKIIDRKKNIFKLSQGEYVSPEKVENIYVRARGVQEAFIDGDSLNNYCVGVIIPNPEVIVKIAAELNINETDVATLCKNKEINAWYLKTIHEFGKKEGLFTFEQPQKIYLEPVSLAVHGCLTTSFKLQRHHAKVHFKKVIEDLYKD